MSPIRGLKRLLPGHLRRQYAIRFRLLRASLAPEAIRAERRADALLVSYPKCGRTWLTMLLARAMANAAGLSERELDYLANDLLGGKVGDLPHVRISHDDNPHWKTPRQLARSKRRYREKRVILLVRDPRDTVVSMYFERTRRERAYAGTLSEFLRERRGSLDTILAYYDVWAREGARLAHFCRVRYEDLKLDAAGEVRRILRFAGATSVTDEHVAEAVRFASFENMRAMEAGEALGSGRLRARDKNDAESFKDAQGQGRRLHGVPDPAEIEWMEERIRSSLDPSYGYGGHAPRPEPKRSFPAETGAASPERA
jgi:hypothetical protein